MQSGVIRVLVAVVHSCGTYDSVLVGPRLQDVATGGNWGLFYSAPQDFVVLGVFCARFPPREASIFYRLTRKGSSPPLSALKL